VIAQTPSINPMHSPADSNLFLPSLQKAWVFKMREPHGIFLNTMIASYGVWPSTEFFGATIVLSSRICDVTVADCQLQQLVLFCVCGN